VVAFPREIAPELRWHLERFVPPGPDSRIFTGPQGGRLRRSNFRLTWIKARDAAGLSGLHLHDLRHTGNAMAAATGASLRELMDRMGHSSTRAALIYQHATRERDEAIATAMGELFATAQGEGHGQGPIGHAAGTTEWPRVLIATRLHGGIAPDLGLCGGAGEGGAGEGNRTLMTSLEGWGSAIELRPRGGRAGFRPASSATRVAYRLSAAAWSADGRHWGARAWDAVHG
jgi:hypothetical protein